MTRLPMELPAVPEEVSTKSDQEILTALLQDVDDIRGCFRRLIEALYDDETFSSERIALDEETRRGGQASLERLQTQQLKILLQVRRAIIKIFKRKNKQERNDIQALIASIGDGDLMSALYDDVKGKCNEDLFEQAVGDMRFSPGFQMRIAHGVYHRMSYVFAMQNKHIRPDVQVQLVTGDGGRTFAPLARYIIENSSANAVKMMRVLFAIEGINGDPLRQLFVCARKDIHPEILEIIRKDEKLNLIYQAKTDPDAELRMIQDAVARGDEGLVRDIWKYFSETFKHKSSMAELQKLQLELLFG